MIAGCDVDVASMMLVIMLCCVVTVSTGWGGVLGVESSSHYCELCTALHTSTSWLELLGRIRIREQGQRLLTGVSEE